MPVDKEKIVPDLFGCWGECETDCPVYLTKVKAGMCGCRGVDVCTDLDAFYDGDGL